MFFYYIYKKKNGFCYVRFLYNSLVFKARTSQSRFPLCDMLNQHSAQIETNDKQMKKYFYILGIILITLAFIDLYIIGLLMYGSYALGLIGIILIFLSNQKLWIKILTIILLPLILSFGIIYLMFNSNI